MSAWPFSTRADDRNRTAVLTEGNGKCIRDDAGIGVAVVDCHHRAQLKLIVAELRDNARLDEVVVANAVVTLVVVLASISGQVGRENRRRVVRRYHRETRPR